MIAMLPQDQMHPAALGILLLGARQKQDWQHADQLVKIVQSQQLKSVPTILFSELCQYAERTKKPHTALQYSGKIMKNGVAVGHLIQFLCKIGKWNESVNVFKKYTTYEHVRLSPQIVCSLLSALAKLNDWKTAIHIVDVRKQKGEEITVGILQQLCEVCEQSGYTRQSWRWRDFP
eukprot:PhF_6_TR43580/c0_g1_i1/m.66933